MKNLLFVILVISFVLSCVTIDQLEGPYFGNGVHNGWADQNSISIWTRLTKSSEMNWEGRKFIDLTKKQADSLAELQNVAMLHSQQIPEGMTLEDMEGACPGSEGEVQ